MIAFGALALLLTAQLPQAPLCPDGTTRKLSEREARCLDDQRREHGPYLRWYPDGQIVEQGSYDRGRRVGEWQSFHANGQLAWKATYVDDWRHGAFTSYEPDGRELERGSYENGNRVGEWFKHSRSEATFSGGPVVPLAPGARRMFPVQTHLAGAFGFGTTTLGRGELQLMAVFGDMNFATTGEGTARFFAMGLLGYVEQPDLSRCTRTCSRWGLGPVVRYGFAARQLEEGAKELPNLGFADWYVGVDLGLLYSRQFVGAPLAGNLDALGVRTAVSITGAGWTRRFFTRSSTTADKVALLPVRFVGADALFAVLGVFNHFGVFVEGSRHYPGVYRLHAGFEFGAGF